MLAEFFDIAKDSADIFEGTQIMGTKWVSEMNRYPVISLSFGNARGDSEDFLFSFLALEVRKEYMRYEFLWEEKKVPENMSRALSEIYESLWNREEPDRNLYLTKSLTELCTALEWYYGKKVKVFIEEYDTPFIQAMVGGFYGKVRPVLSAMLGSLLKGNPSLESAYLTGIQRVAKENLFSGVNNLAVYTVNSPEYADCFGFTEEETKKLLEACGLVLFWVNTGENSLIRSAMEELEEAFRPGYEELIEKGEYCTEVKMDSSYYEISDVETLKCKS